MGSFSFNHEGRNIFDKVRIEGLFGKNDEVIEFQDDEYVKILYGLNGSGKSTVLELIRSALEGDFFMLDKLPFGKITFESTRITRRERRQARLDYPDHVDFDADKLDEALVIESVEFDEQGGAIENPYLNYIFDVDFKDEHSLVIEKLEATECEELVSKTQIEPSNIIILKHSIKRRLNSENVYLSQFTDDLINRYHEKYQNRELSEKEINDYLRPIYEEIGFNNSVILLIRCPDLIDLTDKHWLQIQDELSEEFNIRTDLDSTIPSRYAWPQINPEENEVYISSKKSGSTYQTLRIVRERMTEEMFYSIINDSKSTETDQIIREYKVGGSLNSSNERTIQVIGKLNQIQEKGKVNPIQRFLDVKSHIHLGEIEFQFANWMISSKDAQSSLEEIQKINDERIMKSRIVDLNKKTHFIPAEVYTKSFFDSQYQFFKIGIFNKENLNICYINAERNIGLKFNYDNQLYKLSRSLSQLYEDSLQMIQIQLDEFSKIYNKKKSLYSNSQDLCVQIDETITDDKKSELGIELELISSNILQYYDHFCSSIPLKSSQLETFIQIARMHSSESENILEISKKTISTSQFLQATNDVVTLFRLKSIFEKEFGKELVFDDGGIFFKIGGGKDNNELNQLSSGEKQILLIYMSILTKINRGSFESVVMIDEPELSLHISWQRSFVDNLKELLVDQRIHGDDIDGGYPVKLIMATHSPAILADHFDSSYELGLGDEL